MNESNGSKGMAVAALIFGILSILCCCIGFPFAIIGLILAIIVLAKGKNGRGLAIGGLITSIITLIISVMTAISMAPVMPYIGDCVDFGTNMVQYVEEYQEDGTIPPVFEKMVEDGVITDEDAEQIMDQLITQYSAQIDAMKE